MILWRLALLLALLLPDFIAPTSETGVTCTAGDYTVGQRALITCHFPRNIDTHDGVYMAFYPLNCDKDLDVLECTSTQLTNSKCSGKNGFVFVYTTNRSLTVEVPSVELKFAGRYVCQFVPPDETPRHMCDLTVHGTFPKDDNTLLIVVTITTSLLLVWKVVKHLRRFLCRFNRCSTRRMRRAINQATEDESCERKPPGSAPLDDFRTLLDNTDLGSFTKVKIDPTAQKNEKIKSLSSQLSKESSGHDQKISDPYATYDATIGQVALQPFVPSRKAIEQ